MSEFLRVLTLEQAKAKLGENWHPRPRIVIQPLDNALGCVLAEEVFSKIDVPPFDRAAYDGFAVHASDTFGAGEGSPLELLLKGKITAGEWPKKRLRKGECAEISTGARFRRALIPW